MAKKAKKPAPKKATAPKRVARKPSPMKPEEAAVTAPAAESPVPEKPARKGIQPGQTVTLKSGRTVTKLER